MSDLISRTQAIDALMEKDKKLRNINWYDNPYAEGECGGIDEALSIISNLPSAQPELATDYISKQSVIDAITDENIIRNMDSVMDSEMHRVKRSVHRIIASIPSAQPEIIRCKDCKHHWTHRCMDSMPTEICELDQTFYDANVDFCSLAERRTDGCN